MKRLAWLLAPLCAATLAWAQSPGSASAAVAAVAVPASYVVGPNDVLAMSVYGAPELTDTQMRVDTDGTIHTPYGSTPVHVTGLTVAAIRQAVAAELVKDQLAVNPKVEVTVVDPESHPVTISGQGVRQPGTIQAIQPMRLLDALTKAGGVSDNSGAQITILFPQPQGSWRQQTLSAAQVLSATGDTDDPWLRGGEQIRVMPGGDAYLSGAVALPGAYPLSDSDPLTVRKAMAKAHGLAPAAKATMAQLIHHVGEPDQKVETIDLPGIIAGTKPDIALAANDMIYVPVSGGKKAGLDAVSRTLGILTVAAGELIVR